MNFNNLLDTTFGPLEFLRPYWLLGIIIVVAISLWRHQRNQYKKTSIIANHLSEHLVTLPETTKSNRLALNLLAIIACIALSGPNVRSVKLPVYELQKAQVIAFDLSFSMYATDIKPNRLSRAKYKAIDLLKQWTEGDKALIAYAGDAFTITPLTTDSNSIINHIPYLSPDLMPERGSRPDLALQKAISLLKNAGYQQGHIVFISDGFDKDSQEKMQEMLKGTKWMVSVLSMATKEGAAIKLNDGSLLKDSNDNIVIPKLNRNTLYPVTQMSDGLLLDFDVSGQDIQLLAAHYDTKELQKEDSESSTKTDNKQPIDDGYWVSLLLIPLFLLFFRKGVFYALLLTVMLPLTTPKVEASIWENDQQNAYQAFQNKNYKEASQVFEDSSWKAAALFKNKQYEQAETVYLNEVKTNPGDANTFYNLGNTQAMQQKYEQALTSFNNALAINPNFKEALANKAAVEKLLQQQEQQKNQSSSDQNKDNQQQDEQQQSSDQQDQEQPSEQQSSEQQSQDGQQQDQQPSSEQQSSEQQSQDSQQQDGQQQDQQPSSEQQSSEQQNQDGQQQDGQQQDQQPSSEQQSSEQQNQDSQQQDGQQQDQQPSSEEKNQNEQQEQSSIAQSNEQSDKQSDEPSEQEESPTDKAVNLTPSEEDLTKNEEYEELPIWLKNMPDDPSLLLRNKMRLEYRKRAANKPVLQNNNGEIW
ncbi:VWA domain-containing protein [Psychromonas sp. SP041]|uniref:vWA domain-containing protein n=1 Tax=Psychromonas sp. SP041 TaxID=1365007 RepID=UPI00040CF672|nr:VWA domain-containing protein [Psychromonas sp. SP041]